MTNKLNFKQIITAGATAAGVSAVINSLLFFIFQAAGVLTDTVFVQPNQPLTVIPVIISSILPTLIGACIFFLFEKYGNNGFKTFSIISVVLVLLSLLSPFMSVTGMPLAFGLVLDAMHLVVAGSLLYFINRAKK
jgi:hypothetical protein